MYEVLSIQILPTYPTMQCYKPQIEIVPKLTKKLTLSLV